VTPPAPRSERGAALLAVLVLVVIMSGIAVGAFEKLRVATATAINGASLDQSRAYAIGVETLLALRIDDLVAASPEKTTLAGGWNGDRRRIELPVGGEADARISDGGNCFNINSLVEGEQPTLLKARPLGVSEFANLMRVLGIAEAPAREIAAAATDWADSDSVPGPNGAEDGAYASAEPPYRPANTFFAEVSELRAIAGMSPDVYRRIRPFLCALPTADLSPINVNTLLPDQAPLIAMLAPDSINVGAVRQVLLRRPATGWTNISQFWQDPVLRGAVLPLDAQLQPQLKTSWFAVDLAVRLRGSELVETALVDARRTPSRVAVRRWGPDE
jgi:general secretion pathway protein K